MHDHGVTSTSARHVRRLWFVVVTTSLVVVAQVVGAMLSGSLALLADAGHSVTDVVGLVVALVAVRLGARAATRRHTFGYLRLEVFAAGANALLLLVVAALVVSEAVSRWGDPPEVRAGIMIVFAAVGLAVNLVGLLVLREGAKESLNIRGAYLEVFGDMLGSVAVLVGGVLIAATGVALFDPIASLAVAALIVPRAVVLVRQVAHVLLEGTPDGLEVEEVRRHILGVDGVVAVHDLHVWQLTSGAPVMSAHVVVDDQALAACGTDGVLDSLSACLAEHFDVAHSTFQVEPVGHHAHEERLHE